MSAKRLMTQTQLDRRALELFGLVKRYIRAGWPNADAFLADLAEAGTVIDALDFDAWLDGEDDAITTSDLFAIMAMTGLTLNPPKGDR